MYWNDEVAANADPSSPVGLALTTEFSADPRRSSPVRQPPLRALPVPARAEFPTGQRFPLREKAAASGPGSLLDSATGVPETDCNSSTGSPGPIRARTGRACFPSL